MTLRSCMALAALTIAVWPGAAGAEELEKATHNAYTDSLPIAHMQHDGSGESLCLGLIGRVLSADDRPHDAGACPPGAKPVEEMVEQFQRDRAAEGEARQRERKRKQRTRAARRRAELRARAAMRATYISGSQAGVPSAAPAAVRAAVLAANAIADTPYVWGGGHASFESAGYDCSGAVSFALNGAGLLDTPLASGDLSEWGEPGPGRWITLYANSGHVWMTMAGLAFDTAGGDGPRWHPSPVSSTEGYAVRHPAGF